MAHRFASKGDGNGAAPHSGAIASFVVDHQQTCAVLACSGEIDVSTVSAFREAMQEAARSSQRIIVDLSEVSFLDSTGLGVIVWGVKATRGREPPNEALCLVGPAGPVLKVLAVTGLTTFVPVRASVEEAIAQST